MGFDNSLEIKYRLGEEGNRLRRPHPTCEERGSGALSEGRGLTKSKSGLAPPRKTLTVQAINPPIMADDTTRVQYHRLLGSGLRLNLAAVEVNVSTESSILSESPRVDILLLRREGPAWTEAQRARLPDGIRDSSAAHVLIEFKYTESVTEDGILQAAAYDLFYRQVQKLSGDQTLPVVLSAKTPQRSRLAKWGYEESERGVFRTNLPFVGRVMLLTLNRLPTRSNNAIVKLFASRDQERDAGFASLDRSVLEESIDLHAYVLGLSQIFNAEGELDMAEVITPEKVLEYGKRIRELVFETGTPEERMAGLGLEERLAGLTSKERRELLRLLQEEMDAGAENGSDSSEST